MKSCPDCSGTGLIDTFNTAVFAGLGWGYWPEDCETCNGSGKIEDKNENKTSN